MPAEALHESAQSLALTRTPLPTGHGGKNWVTELRPGRTGELPHYLQHIAAAVMRRGVPRDRAYAIAVSAPKRWLHSPHSEKSTKAASAITVAQWEKDRAMTKLRRVAKDAKDKLHLHEVQVPPSMSALIAADQARLVEGIAQSLGSEVLEAALERVWFADGTPISPREHDLDALAETAAYALVIHEAASRERDTGRFTNLLKKLRALPAIDRDEGGALKIPGLRPAPGPRPSLAEACALVLQERRILQAKREELLRKGQAIRNADGSIAYPIETPEDLKAAAVLARSGHGNVPAAKRLIAKMSRKFGVPNPLTEALAESVSDQLRLQASEALVLQERRILTAKRRELAAKGWALPDGSYPIETVSDLRNAAILAKSGHGDVPEARRLIAKRARALGVPNPLQEAERSLKVGDHVKIAGKRHRIIAIKGAKALTRPAGPGRHPFSLHPLSDLTRLREGIVTDHVRREVTMKPVEHIVHAIRLLH